MLKSPTITPVFMWKSNFFCVQKDDNEHKYTLCVNLTLVDVAIRAKVV